jgi:N-acetyl-anhydromuramyl-L-alanine amidase AmpD
MMNPSNKSMALSIKNIPLNKGEYYDNETKKDTIYIHHTAGSHRPDYVVAGWNADKSKSGGQLPVATAYVIGGASTSDADVSWNGVICQCFPENKWAHHLGLEQANNTALNSKSIAIELCNYGPLTLLQDGRYMNYVNRPGPASMAVKLPKPFRNYAYYHKYTNEQLASLKQLLPDLANRYNIDLKTGLHPLLNAGNGSDAFQLNRDALAGKPGLWTHTNVRGDKFDCSPQDALMEMIKSL